MSRPVATAASDGAGETPTMSFEDAVAASKAADLKLSPANVSVCVSVRGHVCVRVFVCAGRVVHVCARRRRHDNVHTPLQSLRLYKYYKQATVGPCNVPKPSMLDFRAHAKWCVWVVQRVVCFATDTDWCGCREAWSSAKDMDQATAKLEYVKAAMDLVPGALALGRCSS